jgi:hypothetical protein
MFVANFTDHMPTNWADLCEAGNHPQDCQLLQYVVPTFKYAAGERKFGSAFAYAINNLRCHSASAGLTVESASVEI